jgi:hypothetical protein
MRFGILCEKVGAGKSIEILSLLQEKPRIKCELFNNTDNMHVHKGLILKPIQYIDTNLLIVPHYIFN